ncbi:amidohydrolase [uncultured Tenacibaculum sp.]|uniref:amidohydrolase n=1 Tax=uncultured Tenacibaculum sp. TaxID=174713 RepID=UPI002607410D|nr:amidohydrolase [uncultured Tenacibaculum sp.]
MKIIVLILSLILGSQSCSKRESISITASNQKLYFNGKIYTVNESQPWAEAMIIEKNKIVFVGSNSEARNALDNAVEEIDLKGKLVLPGFHDVHMHPMEVGATSTTFTLDENEEDINNYLPIIKQASQEQIDNDWLIGFGHSINTLLASEESPLLLLDEIVPNRPVIIMEHTSHSMWVNSKALELADFTDSSENPTGGILIKEAGKLNGILIDNAGDIVFQIAQKSLENSNNEYDGMVNYVLPELTKNGITSVSDARTYWKRNQHKVWQQLAEDKMLTARFNLGLWAYPETDDDAQIASLKSLFSNNKNSLLKINQIKLYSDGITHNTTAALHTDYHVDYFNKTTNNGLNYFSENRIAKYIRELEGVGFDFHIHAIGNRGVHEAINAIENASNLENRHRLTHVEMVDSEDITRFKQLNITADAQVAGEFTKPEFWQENAELVGTTLANNLVPIKSLTDANVRLTLSSDWNVSTLNPFVGIQNAVTRNPQNILLQEAIKAYTINGAYVMRQENEVGSLEVGKLADFIVVDQNIFTIPTNQINQTKVIRTVFNGNEIYKK